MDRTDDKLDGVGVVAPREPSTGQPARSSRVPGIDGLRALAALWVVLFHMGAFAGGGALWPGVDFLVRSGSTGVSLFLVLSGLCLYLPFAGGRASRFATDDFFRRRVRRLFPAYFATLVLLLVVHAAFGGRFGLPSYSAGELVTQGVTHATLVHQLFPETFYGLNGAYWSLGLEWELYLTLPLLVVAAVRFGLGRTVAAVIGVTAAYRLGLFVAIETGQLDGDGALAAVVLPNFFLGRWAEFALGMLAAEWFRTRKVLFSRKQLALAAAAAITALVLPDNPLNHILYGFLFFTLVGVVLAGDNPVARAISWRPLVAIGVMSYSLYLVHQPMVEVMAHFLGANDGADSRQVFLAMLAMLPLILAAAFALFYAVERRSLSKGSAKKPVLELMFPPGSTHGELPPVPDRAVAIPVATAAQELP